MSLPPESLTPGEISPREAWIETIKPEEISVGRDWIETLEFWGKANNMIIIY